MTSAGGVRSRWARSGRRPARPEPAVRLGVAFLLEQHLGLGTYADSLIAASGQAPDIDARWIPIHYGRGHGRMERMPMPDSLRAIMRARAEIKQGLASGVVDVRVFNTQVPAALAPRIARASPYIVITDVTPRQYDRMASGYGHAADRPGPLRVAKHAWNRHVFRGACRTIGWSSWVRQSLIDEYGIAADRAIVIPPGVDLTQWRPGSSRPDDRVRILFVGGDFDRKGGRDLLDAFTALPPGRAELVVVTRSRVDRRPDLTVIDDLGPNDERLRQLFRSSDVFVLPSRSETFGIAAVEASASALPVIATAVGGLTDIVADGITGFTIAPGDLEALGKRLRQLVDSSELRQRLGGAARSRAVAMFDARKNAARLFDLVRGCASMS